MSVLILPGEMDPNQILDPYRANVVLSLKGDSLVDTAKGKTVILNGASISSANSLFGHSTFLTGLNQWAEVNANSDFVFGTGDFTIEVSVKRASGTGAVALLDFYSGSAWQFYCPNNNTFTFYTTGNVFSFPINDISNGNWHHLCVERSNGILFGYQNGELRGLTPNTQLLDTQNPKLGIGAQVSSRSQDYDFTGNIGNIRITKGVGRYNGRSYNIPQRDFSTVLGSVPPQFAGSGVISGTVRIKGDSMPGSKVILLEETSDRLVSETVSDINGNFAFTNLNTNNQFYIVAKPNAENPAWEYRVSSRRTPV